MGNGIPTRDGKLMIAPMYGPPEAYRETIERVRALPVRMLATGHEPILRDELVADLALTVDGHLGELVAAGRAEVASADPRRFRSRA